MKTLNRSIFFAMNLQMFNTGDTVVHTTGGYVNNQTGANTAYAGNESMSAEMKTYYNQELIDMASPSLVHQQHGKKRPIPQGRGKKIEWRKFSSFKKALTPLTEGVTPTGNKMNVTYIEKELDQYGDYTTVSDVLELTAIDDVILECTDKHGQNAGLTLDTVTRNELVTGTNVIYAPTVAGTTETTVTSRYALDSTAKLTSSLVAKAATFLKKQNAPKIDGCYIAIIHPSVAYDLRQSEGWLDAHKYADPSAIFEGEIGKLHGVRFMETTEAKIFKGSNLASDSATLTVSAAATASSTVSFDGGTVVADALIGREVIIGTNRYYVGDNTSSQLTLYTDKACTTAASVTCADNAVIYPGEGGKDGVATYSTLFFGKDAYGVCDITGGGTEVIVKAKGSGGTSDPLNQRSSIGWKALFGAKILVPEYLVRVETGSSFSSVDDAN